MNRSVLLSWRCARRALAAAKAPQPTGRGWVFGWPAASFWSAGRRFSPILIILISNRCVRQKPLDSVVRCGIVWVFFSAVAGVAVLRLVLSCRTFCLAVTFVPRRHGRSLLLSSWFDVVVSASRRGPV